MPGTKDGRELIKGERRGRPGAKDGRGVIKRRKEGGQGGAGTREGDRG